MTVYRADANDEDVHGIRRFEVVRLLCPLRIGVLTHAGEIEFDVAFVEAWSRSNFSERSKAHRFKRKDNLESETGLSIIDIKIIFRPVHMTPTWDNKDPDTIFLNHRTDTHAWMNFY